MEEAILQGAQRLNDFMLLLVGRLEKEGCEVKVAPRNLCSGYGYDTHPRWIDGIQVTHAIWAFWEGKHNRLQIETRQSLSQLAEPTYFYEPFDLEAIAAELFKYVAMRKEQKREREKKALNKAKAAELVDKVRSLLTPRLSRLVEVVPYTGRKVRLQLRVTSSEAQVVVAALSDLSSK